MSSAQATVEQFQELFSPVTDEVLATLDDIRRAEKFPPVAIEYDPRWQPLFLRSVPGSTSFYSLQYLPVDTWRDEESLRLIHRLDEQLQQVPGLTGACLEYRPDLNAIVSLVANIERPSDDRDVIAPGPVQLICEGESSRDRFAEADIPCIGSVGDFDVFGSCLVASPYKLHYSIVRRSK